ARVWLITPQVASETPMRQIKVELTEDHDKLAWVRVYHLVGGKRAGQKAETTLMEKGESQLVTVAPNDLLCVVALNIGMREPRRASVRVVDASIELSVDPPRFDLTDQHQVLQLTAMANNLPPNVKRAGFEVQFGNQPPQALKVHDDTSGTLFCQLTDKFGCFGDTTIAIRLYDRTTGLKKPLLAEVKVPVIVKMDPPILMLREDVKADVGKPTAIVASAQNISAGSTYEWDYGDGTPPEKTDGAQTTHVFAKDGKFRVHVRLLDSGGKELTTSWCFATALVGKTIEIRKTYHPNGQLKSEEPIYWGYRVPSMPETKYAVIHGLSREWDDKGILIYESTYVDGKRTGKYKSYHRHNGEIREEGQYENSQPCGLWKEYDDIGQVMAEGRYEKGQKQGVWRERYYHASHVRDQRLVKIYTGSDNTYLDGRRIDSKGWGKYEEKVGPIYKP
ncbi:MAG TPA: PKD domain-containing protein, partial [Candidatus Ozemobacteraceae bacterium]|nr:PKD domain-containing protein [Candidatus Ozemobacteraceae bacterium]